MTKLAEIIEKAIAEAHGPWFAASVESSGTAKAMRDEVSDVELSVAILAALGRAGYAVVPKVATYDMVMDGFQHVEDPSPHNLEAAWLAMIESAQEELMGL
jgi:hypothetical protein